MLLKDHIEKNYKSTRQFCQLSGAYRESVKRWISYGCTINESTGEIQRTQVKHQCKEWASK